MAEVFAKELGIELPKDGRALGQRRFGTKIPGNGLELKADHDAVEDWARGMAGVDRHVAIAEVPPSVIVSTIFLGIDHRHSIFGDGPPLLFETMVFKDGESDDQERYSTWEEAEAGHARIVAEQRRRIAN